MASSLSSRGKAYALLVLIMLLGIIGLMMIVLLMISWRRFAERERKRKRVETHMPDMWQAGGDRLIHRIDQGQVELPDPMEGDGPDREPEEPEAPAL